MVINIKYLVSLVDDNKMPELFEALDELNIADNQYSKLKYEYINGKFDYEFPNRLKTYIINLPKLLILQNNYPQYTKRGEILYHIPATMQVQKETKCIVRIAIDKQAITKNLEISEETKIEQVRISEVMEVVLEEPTGEKHFEIKALSNIEQFIDFDVNEFTEWLFFVRPLQQGKYTLRLKVAVIEVINEKERKKEIPFERNIEVVTLANDETVGFEKMPVTLLVDAIKGNNSNYNDLIKELDKILTINGNSNIIIQDSIIDIHQRTDLQKALYFINNLQLADFFTFMENKVHDKLELKKLKKKFIMNDIDSGYYEQLKTYAHHILDISKRGHLVHKLKAKDSTGRWAYYFVLIENPEKEIAFIEAIKGNGIMDIEDYGQVIASCYGEQPTKEVIHFLKNNYGFEI